MIIQTKYFGEIEIQEDHIINFLEAIPGFPEEKQFIILREDDSDFAFFQSIKTESLCFITLPPGLIIGDYSFDLGKETVKKLELENAEDVFVYSILNIPEDYKKMTANLKAPIVINTKNNKGIQELLDDDEHDLKHPVFRGEE